MKFTKKNKIIAVILAGIFSIGSTFLLARLLKGDEKEETKGPITSVDFEDFEEDEKEQTYKLLKLHEARTVDFSQGVYIRIFGQGTIVFEGSLKDDSGENNQIVLCAAHYDNFENQITNKDYITRYEFTSTNYYNRVSSYGERPAYIGTAQGEDKTETEGMTLYYSEYTDYYIPKPSEKCLKGTDGTTYSFEDLLGRDYRPVEVCDAYILWPTN